MKRTLRWLPVLLAFAAAPAMAQTPTAENTVITNTATVSYTDANGNTYTPVDASVSVTVGFQAGVDATVAATAARKVATLGLIFASASCSALGSFMARFSKWQAFSQSTYE